MTSESGFTLFRLTNLTSFKIEVLSFRKFSITAYGEYSYGYGNSDWWGETLSNVFTDAEDTYYNRYEKPCTPFKGWIYGVTLGFSFNL